MREVFECGCVAELYTDDSGIDRIRLTHGSHINTERNPPARVPERDR